MNIRIAAATCAFIGLAVMISAVGVDKKGGAPDEAATATATKKTALGVEPKAAPAERKAPAETGDKAAPMLRKASAGVEEKAPQAVRKSAASGVAPQVQGIAPRGIEPVPPSPPQPRPPVGDFHVSVWTSRQSYAIGERIRVYFRTSRDANVFVFCEDPAGETRQFFPNYYDRSNFVEGGTTYYVPDGNYELKVTGPRGPNRITIVAVRNKYPFFNDWKNYSQGDPFPHAGGGAPAFLQRLKSAGPPQAQGIEPRGIEPVPADRQYAEASTTFRVEGGGSPFPFDTGGITIDTRPQGAAVYFDGRYMGKTPLQLRDLKARDYDVRISRRGYQDYEHEVTIRRGESRSYSIKLDSW